MAKQGSKGNRKRNSERQKQRYKEHPFKILSNKIARLRRHIKRNETMAKKKEKKGRVIKIDQQAINRLKSLTK